MDRPETREKSLSEKLFDDRILFLLGEVNPNSAAQIVMGLLYLESVAPKEDIFLFIDSPGGAVQSGLSICDTIRFIDCDVWTVCVGMAASMGAVILACGSAGKRVCFPNARVMIHQPLNSLGNAYYQATDLQIQAREIMRIRERLNSILAQQTGQSAERINQDTERDLWLFAQEAQDYGLIDCVAENRRDLARMVKQRRESGL